jgi:hypothetical protein
MEVRLAFVYQAHDSWRIVKILWKNGTLCKSAPVGCFFARVWSEIKLGVTKVLLNPKF